MSPVPVVTRSGWFLSRVAAGTGPRRWAAVVVALVAGLAVVFTPTTPAYAHAQLVSTSPANGARLDVPPTEVVLRFTEQVNTVRDGVRLLDATGIPRHTASAQLVAGEGTQVRLAIPADLKDGIYTVAWRVVSADSHPIHGAFVFGVGDVTVTALPDAGAQADGDRTLGAVFWVARLLGYAGLALLAGGVAFLVLCWRNGLHTRRARQIVTTGWVTSVVCAAAVLLLQGPYAAGRTVGSLFSPALLGATLGTDYGRFVLARLVLLALGGVALLLWYRRPADQPLQWTVAGGLAVALPITWVGTGHANAEASILAAASDAIHLMAMSVWFGGLVVLASTALSTVDERPVAEIAAALTRFSRIATGCVAVLVVTGTYQAWRGVGSLAALAGSTYGRLLVFKLAAVAILLWFGAMSRSVVQRRYVRPVLSTPDLTPTTVGTAARRARRPSTVSSRTERRAERVAHEQDLHARRQLRWSVRIEAAIGIAVLALTAMLVATPPGARPEAAVAAPPVPEVATAQLALDGGGRVDIRLAPARVGPTTLTLDVRDAAGVRWRVPEVDASFSLPANGLGPLPVTFENTAPGTWASQGFSLPMAGTWQVQVKVRTTDVDQYTVKTEVRVG